jgi:hypothetical protein
MLTNKRNVLDSPTAPLRHLLPNSEAIDVRWIPLRELDQYTNAPSVLIVRTLASLASGS